MKKWAIGVVGVLVVLVCVFMAVKKVSPISWGMWGNYNTASGVALKGYDPVAYFKVSKPVPGSDEHTYEWGDATWQFSSADNMVLFQEDPESYAPQYGGFCSFAASKGFTADISPDAWYIKDGKLYVFADSGVKADWVDGIEAGTLEASTENWQDR